MLEELFQFHVFTGIVTDHTNGEYLKGLPRTRGKKIKELASNQYPRRPLFALRLRVQCAVEARENAAIFLAAFPQREYILHFRLCDSLHFRLYNSPIAVHKACYLAFSEDLPFFQVRL